MRKPTSNDWMWAATAGAGGLVLAAILWPKKASAAMTMPNMPPGFPPAGAPPAASNVYTARRYVPYSPELKMLLQSAATGAGLPQTWADPSTTEGRAMHRLIEKESQGYVGRPNYHFGTYAQLDQIDRWSDVWRAIQNGTWRSLVIDQYKDKPSSATGLGQLTITNISTGKYYPSSAYGIGVPLEEAIGMMRYVRDRYKDPIAALAFHDSNRWY